MTIYATWNPSDKSAYITLSGGNLTAQATNQSWKSARATMGKAAGKWYFEVTIDSGNAQNGVGIGTLAADINSYVGGNDYGWSYLGQYGRKYHNASWQNYGSAFGAGVVIGVALDIDNGEVYFSRSGVWQASGDPVTRANPAFTGITGTLYPMISLYANTNQATANFGASAFSYSVPSGYNSGIYETEQTELEDASLDLETWGSNLEDLASFLRAHNGLELYDLQAKLEAADWSIEDLASFLSAYYENMDDAGMDLATWATHYDDPKLFLSAWYQHMEDMNTNLETWATGYGDLKAMMEAADWNIEDLAAWLCAWGQELSSLAVMLHAGGQALKNLDLFLYVTDGIFLKDLGCLLSASSGVVETDLGVFLRAISSVPVFKSITAQRVSAVVSEVT